MKLGLYGVGLGAMAAPDGAHIAVLAEELGFESLWTGEHMLVPSPQQPPSHRDPKHPFLDPLIVLSHLAAVTSRIKLAPGVLLLPQRHPVHLAKELASLDVLSRGRLLVGIGVGYVKPEMHALGVDPRVRGAMADESLSVLHTLWCDPEPRFDGRFTSFAGVDAYPRPTTPGGPPIIVGGTGPLALRRAVRFGQGWYGFGMSVEAVRPVVAALRELSEAAGRCPLEITVTPDRRLTKPLIAEYTNAGVSRLVARAEGPDLAAVEARIRDLAALR